MKTAIIQSIADILSDTQLTKIPLLQYEFSTAAKRDKLKRMLSQYPNFIFSHVRQKLGDIFAQN
jgi:hypothetical protein